MTLPERYARHIAPKGRWFLWAEERNHYEMRIAMLDIALREANAKIAELTARLARLTDEKPDQT